MYYKILNGMTAFKKLKRCEKTKMFQNLIGLAWGLEHMYTSVNTCGLLPSQLLLVSES